MHCIFKVRVRSLHRYNYGANRTRDNDATRHNDLDVYESNEFVHLGNGRQWCGSRPQRRIRPDLGQRGVSWEERVTWLDYHQGA